ncbi:MAG: GNAT family N-acetyltransferase [Bacteroidia bacterium]
MKIQFKVNAKVTADDVITIFKDSGIDRPINDSIRMKNILDNSNLIVTAWDGIELIGIARSITDYHYCCYLSDIAVKKKYQKAGIGRSLIEITQNTVGDQTMLILIATNTTMEYYQKSGFDKIENGLLIKKRS